MDTRLRRRELDEASKELLHPQLYTGTAFYILLGILLIIIFWFLYSWYLQLSQGLGVTGMRTPVGTAWGIYIVSFVFFVGVAHGGIAIAAAIRLFKLHKYTPVARMGEVLTVISLMMAGLSILIDLGRPDRVFNLITYWPQRIEESPLGWDVTVILLYFSLSASYLWLTMRKDLAACLGRFPRLGVIYRILLVGYRPDEEDKIERMAWWLSIAIVFLIVMLSGGVVAWIFGLLPAQAGWFGAQAGPYFLTAAIASAIAAVIVVAAILGRLFNWQAYIKPEIFRGLGSFLGVVTLFYLYLMFAEELTRTYASPLSKLVISEMLLHGQFTLLFWLMSIFGFFVPAVFLVAQAIQPKWFNVTGIAVASALIMVAFWIKRYLIVVPSLLRPIQPFTTGSYSPSWVEWSIVAGIFATAILLFSLFLKLFPIVELKE